VGYSGVISLEKSGTTSKVGRNAMSGLVGRLWVWFLGIAISGASSLGCNCVHAQISSDNSLPISSDESLPNNSIITQNGRIFNITGGTTSGGNLFHSFKKFSVPENRTAWFRNADNIQNVISRVTGGSMSNIDGLIRTNGTANLFLINPSGIVFGPNARLNVGGSFVASTANAIGFGHENFFSADNLSNSALLSINPSALWFNQVAAASIENNSTASAGLALLSGAESTGLRIPARGLRVPEGESLLLVGGNINMDGGSLNAFGGRVELGGLAAPGAVELNVTDNNISLSFPDNAPLASVSLTNGAEVNVAAGGGGSIAIHARDIDILEGSSLRAGISPLAGSENAQAGDITLDATGTVRIADNSFVYNAVFGSGNGGSVSVDTEKLMVRDGVIASATISGGRSGNLMVNASEVELSGSPLSDGYISTDIPVVFPISLFGFFLGFQDINIPITTPIGLFSA
jgi:filamentous hemagglutinin family protein